MRTRSALDQIGDQGLYVLEVKGLREQEFDTTMSDFILI